MMKGEALNLKVKETSIPMNGASGTQIINVQSNKKREYSFISIVNPTDNIIDIYPQYATDFDGLGFAKFRILPYNSQIFPITQDIAEGFKVKWSNPKGTQGPKYARALFTDKQINMNLNMVQSAQVAEDYIQKVTPNPGDQWAVAPAAGANFPVTLSGSNAPLKADAPRLLFTKDYTNFATATTKYFTANGLNRNARQRTFHVVSTMGVTLTNCQLSFSDSSCSGGGWPNLPVAVFANIYAGITTDTSENHPLLAAHADTVMLSITVGTVPGAGNISLYVTEVF
jgi:hypothetical protein